MDVWGMGKGRNPSIEGVEVRKLALSCIRRISESGSYANIVLPSTLKKSNLDQRDKNLVTEIVYGATRMQRSLDWSVDRFLMKPPPNALRASLRVGAYQIMYTRIPPHAAVSTTVEASSKKNRGVVNAVLRKLTENIPEEWPNEGTRLSYPDWICELVKNEHGVNDGLEMLENMNNRPKVTERQDGYVQDLGSQWVVEKVNAKPGDIVLDLCAAPGGKATAISAKGAYVIASDIRHSRTNLVAANIEELQLDNISLVTADGTSPCFGQGVFDKVLVDAPCSGLGVLHRRADARWRVRATDIDSLAALQINLLRSAKGLVKPGGLLIYSVCTITNAETQEVANRFEKSVDGIFPIPIKDPLWREKGNGGVLLPQDHDTDGMSLFIWGID